MAKNSSTPSNGDDEYGKLQVYQLLLPPNVILNQGPEHIKNPNSTVTVSKSFCSSLTSSYAERINAMLPIHPLPRNEIFNRPNVSNQGPDSSSNQSLGNGNNPNSTVTDSESTCISTLERNMPITAIELGDEQSNKNISSHRDKDSESPCTSTLKQTDQKTTSTSSMDEDQNPTSTTLQKEKDSKLPCTSPSMDQGQKSDSPCISTFDRNMLVTLTEPGDEQSMKSTLSNRGKDSSRCISTLKPDYQNSGAPCTTSAMDEDQNPTAKTLPNGKDSELPCIFTLLPDDHQSMSWMNRNHYKCNICQDFKTKSKRGFLLHINIKHDLASYDDYKLKQGDPKNMSIIFICRICNVVMDHDEYDIQHHLEDDHRGMSIQDYQSKFNISMLPKDEDEKLMFDWDRCEYSCPICKKISKTKKIAMNHLKVNHPERRGLLKQSINLILKHKCKMCSKYILFEKCLIRSHLKHYHLMYLTDYEKLFKSELNATFAKLFKTRLR